ncbi:SAM-dependent methyltransferase [Nonomuraea sp. NPDC050404]|uniref:SAM-dependent methyltransferase n=1 Tax=Nonomuraea sp. NPDC050404 TaxID=3155783 RepID=UPI0033CA85DD
MTLDNSTVDPPDGGPGRTFDPNMPAPARTYAVLRGANRDGFAADREAARVLQQTIHEKVDEVVQENAAALVRAVAHLARQGFVQFADLGCGRPVDAPDALGLPNLYDVAAAVNPGVRWLALDSDQLVVTACRALLRGPNVEVVQQDLAHSAKVLDAINWHLCGATPVVVLMGAVLHFLTDEQCTNLRFALRSRLKPRSKIVITHVTGDGMDPDVVKRGQIRYEELHGVPMYVRTEHEVMGLVRDFHVPDPGVVRTVDFLPEPGDRIPLEDLPHFYAVLAEVRD